MATRVRSVDFLPEIFQTPVNKQFLASTLDQLVQEPQFSPSQGYIGRRIGPGVNANDKYVVEPDANRANYQLEPAVVFKKPDTETTQDLITYPGIVDTLELKGAKTNRADRLWDSQYYCWDPFIDFDKMINFSEYYWVPAGPDAVQVSASTLAAQTNIEVYRENGYYRFLGTQGSNPTLTLIRGLSYNFNVTQNLTTTFNYRVTNRGSQAYVIDFANNPTLTLIRGNTYQFNIVTSGDFPFWIKNVASTGTANAYNRGVTNNGARSGLVTFKVPYDAPDTLYYTSETSQFMQGQFNISDPKSGTGPGFWIQVDPGADGRIAATPNINGRDVLGVVNNGEDFGTVTFNVPSKTAQNFYYTLPEIPAVDLVCDLKFDQVNGTYVEDFIEQYGGIDGTTDLEFKTIVFPAQNRVLNTDDALVYGWVRNFPYSPFPTPEPEYVGQPGSYDIPDYSEAVPLITKTDRYQVFQILYRQDLYGATYIELVDFRKINKFEKFFVLSGDVYANTQWYKNAEEYLERIPLLSAVLDTLFYQDGADPNQYGQIRLIEQNEAETLFISDILGKKNYTSPNGVVFTNGLKVQFRNSVVPQSYANNTYYVEGVGTAIQLLPTENFISPEPFTTGAIIPFDSLPFDVGNYDADQNQPLIPDYLTINRSSQDLNAWSRSNRWFHRQVLEQTAAYTAQVADLNQDLRAKRPILEFRGGTKLYNFGTQGKLPINIIDFDTTDAFSTINGQPQYNIDGYNLQTGSRVIFANDSDPLVRGRVYEVTMIDPDTQQPLIDQPIINLTLAEDGIPEYNDTVVCVNGLNLQGTSYWFNGIDWQLAQLKTQLNQQPLFDVFDLQGYSFGDVARYPSSSFSGTKIFSYARGTGANDPYLNFPIQYLTINNVGDIVFDNNYYTDSFLYVVNRASQTKMVSDGFVRQYQDRTNFVNEIGWQPARSNARPYQQFRFDYDGSPLLLDVRVEDVSTNTNLDTSMPPLKVYAGNRFVPPTEYQYTRTSNTTTILLSGTYNQGDVIEVLAYSDQVSAVAFYEIPTNLENNPLNQNSSTFTLGTVRRHYDSIGTNLLDLLGPINGSNNSRDLGNLVPYGGEILQQSSPMPLVGYFLRDTTVDVFDAIAFNGNEYQKFKDILMETVAGLEYNDQTSAELLTLSIGLMTQGKNNLSPFYWSDMLPATTLYEETLYTFTAISTQVFDTVQSYDYTSSNYKALNVYVNDNLLTIGVDYIVNSDALTVTITRALEVGDVIKLQEFASTLGNYVPNTPTKIGLYPAYRPRMYLDTTYQVPTMVILGHDGSKTVAFEDIRDQVLLEFETRIYNNLKIHSDIPITPVEVIPSFFEPTNYTDREIQSILDTSFLTWVGANRLGYTTQDYVQDNPFTWNYSRAGNKLTGTPLKGAWRGIYLDFYNTISPHLTPWEMLGLTQEPSWWQNRYGPAPYTSGNLVLWDDLEAGRIAEPGNDRIDPRYARPGLTQILPVDDQGRLLSPFESIVGAYDPTGFQASWRTGDYGPVEYSWRVSSIYPFALMRLYALTRPAEFFNEFADRDLYQYNAALDQYLYDNRYRLGTNLEIYGQGQSKASYINWVVDFSIWAGDLSAPNTIASDISNIDARLAYRMAGYSDKNYIDLFLEKPTPASSNTSLMLPDESYDLLLYKNQQSDALIYSAVIIQRVAEGYQIFGYSEFKPFFPVLVSRPLGKTKTFIVAGTNIRVPVEYTDEVVEVPYGYVFTNRTVVADFLLSYGQVLQRQGMIFDTVENGNVMNWDQMVEEFLYWSNQGWALNSIIAINPVASVLKISKPGFVVNDISATSEFEQIIDQNREPIDLKNCVIRRFGNDFELTSTNEQSISYVTLSFTQYEHAMVLRNASVFGDLIYNPITGARQSRILFNGFLTDDWDGTVDAQGFILNLDNVEEWRPNLRYTKGQIVKFKNNYWSALGIVQPSRQFNQNEWVQSDYEAIQKGLLPNLPNKANQLANSYNINSANLENDNDLLSYGLIGFRPRQYMAALDLNDISQVNVYQQFLKNKGTVQSVRLISDANLGKESAEYDIYENWAILAGTYGAQYNRRYIDLQLNKALLNSNPSLVQLIDIGGTSIADQPIVINQVFSSSSVVNTPDVLPTTNSTMTYSLPTAGYVNENDVDVSTYSLDQASDLNPFLDQLGIGKTVWVAKTNAYEWNVYRCNGVPGQIVLLTDNLDGTSTVLFNTQHGLTPGRLLIIKNFDSQINGCYRVLLVPSLYTVVIEFSFESGSAIEAVGEGVGLVLDSTRVSQPSSIANLDFANNIRPGAKVWVDNNGNNKWTVLEKTNPTVFNAYITPRLVDGLAEPNTRFATSIDQRQDNLMALIGRPDFDFDRGQVVNYIKNSDPGTPDYVPGQTMDLHGAIGLKNYGWSVDIGLNTWAAAGAPNSGDKPGIGKLGYVGVSAFNGLTTSFEETQLLLPLDVPGPCEFGYSVAMSRDERWLYVGAPLNNSVYVYGKQDVQAQAVEYFAQLGQSTFSTGNIQFTNDKQLLVARNGKEQVLGYNYFVNGTSVIFYTAASIGEYITIARRSSILLDSEMFPNQTQSKTTGFGVNAVFDIRLTRGKYEATIIMPGNAYSVGEILTIPGTRFGGKSPLNDCRLEVTQIEGPGNITGVSATGSFIPLSGLPKQFYLDEYLNPIDDSSSVMVYVDGRLMRPKIDYEIIYSDSSLPDSSASDHLLVFGTPYSDFVPGFGANIVAMNGDYYRYVDKLQVPGLAANARFGHAVASSTDGRMVLVGAPNATHSGEPRAGLVYVFDRYYQKFQVTDANVTTYDPLNPIVQPVNVKQNNTFLTNSIYYNNGTFTDNGTTITVNAPIQVGDSIDIETNQFVLLQTISAHNNQLDSAFGASLDLCRYNCSLYVGQPTYSQVEVPKAGSVDRWVNKPQFYGTITGTVQNPSLVAGDTLRVNGFEIEVPSAPGIDTAVAFAAAITAQVPNVRASVSNGYFTINVINLDAATPGNRLTVLPGAVGTVFTDIGFELFAYTQTLTPPVAFDGQEFGREVNIDTSATILTVGTPYGTIINPVQFDAHRDLLEFAVYQSPYVLNANSPETNPTTFDSGSTTFFDPTVQSGVVYTYNYLTSRSPSVSNPGLFVLGEQIRNDNIQFGDQFGTSISYKNNVLLIGAPGADLVDDSSGNEGAFLKFSNVNNVPAWTPISTQAPVVNVNLINSVSMYDALESTTNQFFDFFNPLLGKVLGAVQSNLDYVSITDPAIYNTTNTPGQVWSIGQEGKIWWDTSMVRFIDTSAGDIKYAANRWGQVFPGSSVQIYQWTRSSEPPSQYTGPGVPYDLEKYTVWSELNLEGIIEPVYFFWVTGITTVAKKIGKTLSPEVIARYIEEPKSSGISFVAPIAPSCIAIYNGLQYVKAQDTILHIEYDLQPNDANVHQEYELVAEEQVKSFINDRLYEKLLDSFAGETTSGIAVPDPSLPPAMRYGVQFNPRQSMFENRFVALQNYIDHANAVMATYPLSENRRFSILNSSDPEPLEVTGAWDKRVLNLEQLGWQDIYIVPLGYTYLVATDSSNSNLWTIYTVVEAADGSRILQLSRVQSWDVRKYWNYVNWYAIGFDPATQIVTEVPLYADLATLTVPIGSAVKVTTNTSNKWEIYQYDGTTWNRVALQDGTIQISPVLYDYALGRFGFDGEVFDAQYFDQTPQVETRKIIEALNQEIFVDDLAIERNRLLILMFNYIISEQRSPTWLIKTSLIDVTHKIRELLPYQTYRRDNQDFVLQYINEVKPYHVQIRQFNLQYSGQDEFYGELTDYDLPAYYDTSVSPPQFVSPILVDMPPAQGSGMDGQQLAVLPNPDTDASLSTVGPDAAIWSTFPYNQWYNNFLLDLESIEIINQGGNYLFPPTVTLSGVAKRLGTLEAVINSAGQVIAINIVDPGEGYYLTPTVNITSVSGGAATAVARMTNTLVRTFNTTINFDRYQYQPNFVPWVPNDTFDNGTLVEYDGRVWEANSPDSTGVNTPTFEPSDWILVPQDELSGVDRTMAYYVATNRTPGKKLPLLISGVDYPGVIVDGVAFDAATGFDSDPYDTYVFDNIQVSPEGTPTYSDRILDTIYSSTFLDQYLGTRPNDVNVEGGAFIDTYSSHAPEELVPGSEFDTLDFRVYTTPGADWLFDGHGWEIDNRRYEADTATPELDFSGLLEFPVAVQVTNVTTQRDLNIDVDFVVDWPNLTVQILQNVNVGDALMLRAFELGGGNQLYRSQQLGGTFGNKLIIPVQFSLIQQLAVFVNGEVYTDFTYTQLPFNQTQVDFDTTFTNLDFVSLTAIGVSPGTVVRSWSKPMTQTIVVTNASQLSYPITLDLEGTNAANILVVKNGIRARPYQCVSIICDGSSDQYFLPTRNGISQGLISDPDVTVYLDNQLQSQLGDYVVDPWDGSSLRLITFLNTPPIGSRLLICVSTRSDYVVSAAAEEITFRTSGTFGLAVGDVIELTTWNDTSQQDLVTMGWQGPVVQGTTVVEPFDSTPFAYGVFVGEPGTFDYSAPGSTTINDLDLGRPNVDPTRLWVTLNGNRLVNNVGFSVAYQNDTSYLILPNILGSADYVAVTMPTDSVVPEAMAFRIFQDMRGIQTVHRITPTTTTTVAQYVYPDADTIYLTDASRVGQPNIANNSWGIVTINAERIMYRYRDLSNNSISGLMRGTGGTAIAEHAVDSIVYDMSSGTLLPPQYQDYVVLTSQISDGKNNVFVAPNLSLEQIDSSLINEGVVRVTVGGITLTPSQYDIITDDPISVQLFTTPPAGVEVVISELRGVTWYAPGINTASNGRPLQETNTEPARFLRGL